MKDKQTNEITTKKELRLMLNVSQSTLHRWLNVRYIHFLIPLGYHKKQKYLTPKQFEVLKIFLVVA